MFLLLAAVITLQDPEPYIFGNIAEVYKTDADGLVHLRVDWPDLTSGQIICVLVEIYDETPTDANPMDPVLIKGPVFAQTYTQTYNIDNHATLPVIAGNKDGKYLFSKKYRIYTTTTIMWWNGQFYYKYVTDHGLCRIYNPVYEP